MANNQVEGHVLPGVLTSNCKVELFFFIVVSPTWMKHATREAEDTIANGLCNFYCLLWIFLRLHSNICLKLWKVVTQKMAKSIHNETLLCAPLANNPWWEKAQYDTAVLILLQRLVDPLQVSDGDCVSAAWRKTFVFSFLFCTAAVSAAQTQVC